MQTKLKPANRPHIRMHNGKWEVIAFRTVDFNAMQFALMWVQRANAELRYLQHAAAMIEAGYMVGNPPSTRRAELSDLRTMRG